MLAPHDPRRQNVFGPNIDIYVRVIVRYETIGCVIVQYLGISKGFHHRPRLLAIGIIFKLKLIVPDPISVGFA